MNLSVRSSDNDSIVKHDLLVKIQSDDAGVAGALAPAPLSSIDTVPFGQCLGDTGVRPQLLHNIERQLSLNRGEPLVDLLADPSSVSPLGVADIDGGTTRFVSDTGSLGDIPVDSHLQEFLDLFADP